MFPGHIGGMKIEKISPSKKAPEILSEHCLDVLRKPIMCRGAITLITFGGGAVRQPPNPKLAITEDL